MPKNIIVSNRLPVQVENKNQVWTFTPTSGGLATGLKSVHEEGDSLWIGWPGNQLWSSKCGPYWFYQHVASLTPLVT